MVVCVVSTYKSRASAMARPGVKRPICLPFSFFFETKSLSLPGVTFENSTRRSPYDPTVTEPATDVSVSGPARLILFKTGLSDCFLFLIAKKEHACTIMYVYLSNCQALT